MPAGDPSWYTPVIAVLIAVGVLVFIVAALYAAFWAREQILQKRKQAAQLKLLKEFQAKFPHLHIPVKVVRDEAAEQAAADQAAWEMAKAAAAPQVPAKAPAAQKRQPSADTLASNQAETATLPDITPVEPAIYNGSFAELSASTRRSPKSSEGAAREPRRSPASAASSAERPRRSKPNSPSIEL
jgi:membrane protein involved in colicin uptake